MAVAAARHAFDEGGWSQLVNGQRRDFMVKFADNLVKNRDELAHIESLDNGKPLAMAKIDINTASQVLRYYAGWAEKMHGQTYPMSGPFMAYEKK